MLCFAGFEAVLHALNDPKAVRSGWRYRWGRSETNQLGYRVEDRHTRKTFSHSAVGDSQWSPHRIRWMKCRALLEMEHGRDFGNDKVFSIGTRLWAGPGTAALEDYYAKFRADAVDTVVTFYNDIWKNVFHAQSRRFEQRTQTSYRLDRGRSHGRGRAMLADSIFWTGLAKFTELLPAVYRFVLLTFYFLF